MGTDFYTLQELAAKLEVTNVTISRMIKREELKEGVDFYRLGRQVRFVKKVMVDRFHFSEE